MTSTRLRQNDRERIRLGNTHGGSGPLQAILNGIVYAAQPLAEGGAGAHGQG
jgi:hypothetical protein